MKFNPIGLAIVAMSTLIVPSIAAAQDDLCDGLEGKKLEKCEAKKVKALEKLRSKTTPFKPSKLSDKFADLDGDDVNPLNMDKYYVGVAETGIAPVDDVLVQVMRVNAAVQMGKYVGELEKNGESDKAKALAGPTVEILMQLKDAKDDIMGSVQKLTSTPPTELVDNPADALKVPKALGAVTSAAGQLPKLFTDLPNVMAAVVPLAKAGGGAALDGAMEEAAGAVEGAVEGATGN